MREKEFNLIEEKWIRVMDFDGAVTELSLNELFSKAHEYRDLCGELATQDFAMLRLLLAILHTVFSRYDLDGNESPLECTNDALDRWKALWDNGQFPIKPIEDYLASQKENFYLFHPERPFYQVEGLRSIEKIANGEYDSKKLNGILAKSGNRVRLFQHISEDEASAMTYSQAARWLLNLNGFDDTSIKKKTGLGYLSMLGLVCVMGESLFKTLMLNYIAYNLEDGRIWSVEKPVWETDRGLMTEKEEILYPDNLSQLYTLQSRRILLIRNDDVITRYKVNAGDWFGKHKDRYIIPNIEPMTLWKFYEDGLTWKPQKHDSAKQFWRDFSSCLVHQANDKNPMVVRWQSKVASSFSLDWLMTFKIAALDYDDLNMKVINVFSDSLQLHSSLIAEKNGEWQQVILNSIAFCDDVSKEVWKFAKMIKISAGADCDSKEIKKLIDNGKYKQGKTPVDAAANKAKSDFYNRIDAPFRKWLHGLNPSSDDSVEKEKDWRKDCIRIAEKLGKEMISEIPTSAIFGKLKGSDPKNKKMVSAASAYNRFIRYLNIMKNN